MGATAEICLSVALIIVIIIVLAVVMFPSTCQPMMRRACGASQPLWLNSSGAPVDLAQSVDVPFPLNRTSAPEKVLLKSDVMVDSANLRMGAPPLVDKYGKQVMSTDSINGLSPVAADSSMFTTFKEAPKGVQSTMWPATAEETETPDLTNTPLLPGGNKTETDVFKSYLRAQGELGPARYNETGRIASFGGRSERTMARNLGHSSFVDMIRGYEGQKSTYEEAADKIAARIRAGERVTALNLPEWHPALQIEQEQIDQEDMARHHIGGFAGMGPALVAQADHFH